MPWKRFGRKEGILSFWGPGLFYLTLALATGYTFWPYFYYIKGARLIVIGLFALWRYGWLALNYLRSLVYHFWVYPRLARKAEKALSQNKSLPNRLYFVIPSYREEPWVTLEVMQAFLDEVAELPVPVTAVIATGSEEEDQLITALVSSHPAYHKVELVLQRQEHGKRLAMGTALRAVARRFYKYGEDYRSVTVFMDGDTVMGRGALSKVLSFFLAFPELGALTTNEVAFIRSSSPWYRDWFNMKFGQRHIMFGSHALSRRVLTLTGRFSAFRTVAVVQREFIERLEEDSLEHPLFGRFRFLMGDDKSTWFQLLKDGWDMLYLPDVICYSLESRKGNFFSVSLNLLFRWYGNTLRNNMRALALGPRKVGGLFIWLAILDQRLSMWTGLVGPLSALALTFFVDPVYLPIYFAWIFLVRTIQMGVIAFGGHPVSFRTIPLMIYNQWMGSLVKIWVNFHLAQQRWAKGGARQDVSWVKISHPLAPFLPDWAMFTSTLVFLLFILVSENILAFPDLRAFLSPRSTKVILASDYGVLPDDGKDDAQALNNLIKRAPFGAKIKLPAGTVLLLEALKIKRSGITLEGDGPGKTILLAPPSFSHKALVEIKGKRKRLRLRLSEPVKAGSSRLRFTSQPGLSPGDLILIRRPNDEDFLARIGSLCWRRRYPYLRQEIVAVSQVEGKEVFLERALSFDYPPEVTELFLLQGVRNITLKGFTVVFRLKKRPPQPHVYRNLFPEKAVDLLALKNAAFVRLEDLELLYAGRHPLNLDGVYRIEVSNLRVKGAWNKGKGGFGYVRLARTFASTFSSLYVTELRHLVIQWSSAYNLLRGLKLGVDLNFHGGYPHHNRVEGVVFEIPKDHPWKGVIFTPPEACYAPPNGPGNIILETEWSGPPPR